MIKRYISVALLAVVMLLLFTGCSIIVAINTPPDVISVQQRFLRCHDDIQTVVDFMINAGYETIYIRDSSERMLADLKEVKIDDQIVSAAVKQLLGNKEYISISKRGNTIKFSQWSGSQDIGCGIAYSINGTDAPEIQFMTELVPISEDGWFYYVDDYNTWRSNNS